MGCRKEIIDTYSNDTKEWEEAQEKYVKLQEEIETKIGLIIGPEGLKGASGGGLDKWEKRENQWVIRTN